MLDNRAMGNWLEPFLRSAGLSQEQLAEAIGMSRATINRLANDHSKLKLDRAEELAPHLRVTPEQLMLNKPPRAAAPTRLAIPPGRIAYGGSVAAGLWRLADQYNQDIGEHPMAPPSVPRYPAYPDLPQVAWRVVGNSMELARIYDGDWAVGIPYLDYVDKIGELDNGMFVVVEKSRAGGSEIELTLKEVQFGRHGMRLIPRSTSKYPEYLIPLDHEADPDEETVRIVGVVMWAGRDLASQRNSY